MNLQPWKGMLQIPSAVLGNDYCSQDTRILIRSPQYHHINEWAKFKRHNAADIVLLCNNHHREAGARLLPEKEIRNARLHPYNGNKDRSTDLSLWYGGDTCIVKLGNCRFTAFSGAPLHFIPLA